MATNDSAWRAKVVGLGEALWDILPSGRQIGGAPANFAYCSQLLGDCGMVASRIGDDDLGRELRQAIAERGLLVDHLQVDSSQPTGRVRVEVNGEGQPKFTIEEPAAWDFLGFTPEWRTLAESADAVCFGTLAQRSLQSLKTIQEFLRNTKPVALRIFDLNFRGRFYSSEIVEASLQRANVLKLNDSELPIAAELLRWRYTDPVDFCRQVVDRFSLKLVAITFGGRGSMLTDGLDVHRHSGFEVNVADTVGAGDAFTAGMIHELLRGGSLATMNDTANRMGAWVATQHGGMPPVPKGGLQAALNGLTAAETAQNGEIS